MNDLKLTVKNVNSYQAVKLLGGIYECIDTFDDMCGAPISVVFNFDDEEEAMRIPPAPESTPFSRYIQSATPEGRT